MLLAYNKNYPSATKSLTVYLNVDYYINNDYQNRGEKMDKQKVWFALSECVYDGMKAYYSVGKNMPKVRGKFIMYVMHNFSPDEIMPDYTYQHARRKMICVKLRDSDITFIERLEKKYGRSTSSLARDLLYTFLKEKQIIK
ncbi:hypothetical protein Cpap_3998 [Ruminiclostridium papyrosolvens DSM 2782]|uniref:Uncharacterized protein n=2 Tax=Ruminiclostridium papyrosolvens TaxID=29362 RepID=F1T7W4_9FIRM|nr:hypothetical protein Cpap_3998 [Ruminiclostridium papyrosolvens DSM 2782]